MASHTEEAREQALTQLMHTYGDSIKRMCCVYLKDLGVAEDAAQETFIKAYKNLHTFRGDSSDKTWLFRIAINVCRGMQRTSWFRNISGMVSLDSVQIQQPQKSEISHALMDEIMRLPKKYREVILLYYYEDMKQNEIAEILGVSVTTVCRRIEIDVIDDKFLRRERFFFKRLFHFSVI